MIRFHALGGLTVTDGDGIELSLGGPRLRRLAAMLLIHRNAVVSVDRLAEAVFAGEPTQAASTTLRSYVARIRRVLGDGAGPVVVTQSPGYLLRLPADAFDVACFERLVAEAGSRTEPHAARRTAATLREALGLWRGDAYAEFADEDWARPEAHRLAELRLVALERLVEAELACGRAAEVIPEIRTLTGQHPLREAFRGHLMTALYRAGRQADALEVFRDYRALLVSELGVEPSPSLADLHRRVLNHEQQLMLPEPAGLPLRGYRLGQRLGAGRDGTVYAASLPGVNRDFAVRVITDEIADRPDFVRSFEAAVHRVASVHHAALVPIHDYWREPGAAYLVMRRLDGGSLTDRLGRGRLRGADAAAVVRRIGGALVALAEAGVVHGRVSADCVLFDRAGNAYLGDLPLGLEDPAVSASDDVHDFAQMLTECLAPAPGPVSEVLARGLATVHQPAMAELVVMLLAAITGQAPESDLELPNPYKGLLAFDESDADDFFGRTELVEDVVDRLRRDDLRGRIVLVVGGSGTGKSSVVRAGVLPRVRRGDVAGSERWFVTTMLPGSSPFKELAEGLRRVAVVGTTGLAERLAADTEAVDRVLRSLVPGNGQLLLVIDQLEELFTLATEEDQRAFLHGVMHAVSAPDSRLRVVGTLRADFYDRPLALQPLADVVNDATVTMVPMSHADLEAAIVGPVERVGGTIEQSLVVELVGAVGDEPAALPSLQFTLYELAARSPSKQLELAAYRELGGLAGAIASRAERLYATLEDGAQVAVRRIFERLVVFGVEGEPTRRRAARTELSRRGADLVVDAELDRWAQARLLTFDRNPQTRMPTVELAHEALLHKWPRLGTWIDEDREAIAALGRLREATSTWFELDRDPGALYRGARLEMALDLVDGHRLELPEPEREFLEASTQARDRETSEVAERVARQGRDNRRLRHQRAAVVVALVIALVGGFVAFDQRGEARRERQVASARELAAASVAALTDDPERSVLLALQAVEESRSGGQPALPEAVEALHRALTASRIVLNVPGVGGAVDWSPDGALFVTEGPEDTGIIDLRDAATGESVRSWRGHEDDLNNVVFGPDGKTLATAGDDGTLRVWKTASGASLMVARPVEATDGPIPVRGPSFSRDGTKLAAAWPDAVRVYDVATGRLLATISADGPCSTTFSPDATLVAFASSRDGVVVADIGTGENARILGEDTGNMQDVEWSPDGRWIAAGGGDATVQVWNAATSRLRYSVTEHTSSIWDVEWSRDSRWLASAGDDGVALVSDLSQHGARTLFALSAQDASHGGGTQGVAFAPDGMRLMTGDTAITSTKVWDLSPTGGGEWPSVRGAADLIDDGRNLLVLGEGGVLDVVDLESGGRTRSVRLRFPDGVPDVFWVDVNRDASRVAIIDDVGLTVWDMDTGERRFVAARHEDFPVGVFGWSADGQHLAVALAPGPGDGAIVVFDRDGAEIARLPEVPDNVTTSVALAPDGRTLATTRRGVDKVVPDVPATIWDPLASRAVTTIGDSAERVVFDGSGSRIATSRTVEGIADIWDITTGDRLATLTSASYITALAFSADGTTLATGHSDGTIRLWDAATGVQRMAFQDGQANIETVAFTPDGTKLLSNNEEAVARVWALDIDDLVALAEQRLTRGLSEAECRQYLHLERCADA